MSKIVYFTKFDTFSYSNDYAVKSYEVPDDIETLLLLSEQDFEDGVFVGKNYYPNKYRNDIFLLKQELAKNKEYIEQVEVFGLERDDYEEIKNKCAEIILNIRKLEQELEKNYAII